jgi:hypothetical protein
MDNNLVGQIPSEIVNLPNLQELNLHKTPCQEIPRFENLKELKVLDLSFNRLTDPYLHQQYAYCIIWKMFIFYITFQGVASTNR